jgi:hypothetical protein
MRYIVRLIRSHAGGNDKARHSAQARVRHTGSSACLLLDYAMIRGTFSLYRHFSRKKVRLYRC